MSLLDRAQRGRLEETVNALTESVASLHERLSAVEPAREAADRLSGEVHRLAQRLEAECDKLGKLARDLVKLDRRVTEGEETVEAFRLKVVALAKQMDWESESTRKSFQALLQQSGLLAADALR